MAILTPQDISFADSAPVIVEATRTIAGTPQEVWDAIVDYERWPVWFSAISSCRATSDPATGVGSTREVVLGRTTVAERFIAWDEPTLWAFTATDAPGVLESLVERVTIEPVGADQAAVTYRMAIGPKGWFAPLAKLGAGGIRKNLGKALSGLEQEVVRRRTA